MFGMFFPDTVYDMLVYEMYTKAK